MNKAARAILAIIDTCLLVYLAGFNVYMAYNVSGVIAAIATVVFAPIAFFVWFLIVICQNGLNAYCVAWIASVMLSVVVLKRNPPNNSRGNTSK